MQELKPIKYDKKLSAFDMTNEWPCDDRLTGKLSLDDYDWMDYKFETYFPTKEQGRLVIEVEYFGFATCTMKVDQYHDQHSYTYYHHEFKFDSDIFVKFLKKYMTQHIKQWGKKYAFCGEKLAVELYNNIVKNYKEYRRKAVMKEGESNNEG